MAALVSCQKGNIIPEDSLKEINFKFEIPATKATATAFESGDAVSLYAVEYTADDAPELQISGNFLNNEKYPLKSGFAQRTQSFVCLETQAMPDSINHSNFTNTVLMPGEVYDRTTVYKFSVK